MKIEINVPNLLAQQVNGWFRTHGAVMTINDHNDLLWEYQNKGYPFYPDRYTESILRGILHELALSEGKSQVTLYYEILSTPVTSEVSGAVPELRKEFSKRNPGEPDR